MSNEAFRGTAEGKRLSTWVFNPFHYIAGGQALVAGVVAMLLAGVLNAVTLSHFDGVLDFHTGLVTPWWVSMLEGPVNWLVMSVLFLAGGKLLSTSRFRVLDVLGTQALARVPTLIMALTVMPPQVRLANARLAQAAMAAQSAQPSATGSVFQFISPAELVMVGGVVLVVLMMVAWMVVLMYRAFAVSCNVSGGKAIGLFFALMVAGEIASKVLLGLLYYATLN